MTLQPDDVEEILAILDSTTYEELTLRTPRFALALRRRDGGWTQELTPLGSGPPGEATSPASGPAEPAPPVTGPPEEGLVAVRAPIVGTFYRAPKPGAAPFVEVGDHVEPTSVVAILETMKLMTSVPAGVAGTVVRICLGNAELAETGAPLLWLEPS